MKTLIISCTGNLLLFFTSIGLTATAIISTDEDLQAGLGGAAMLCGFGAFALLLGILDYSSKLENVERKIKG